MNREVWKTCLPLRLFPKSPSQTSLWKTWTLVVATQSSWTIKIKSLDAEMQTKANWASVMPAKIESQSQLRLWMLCRAWQSTKYPVASTTLSYSPIILKREIVGSFGPSEPTTSDKLETIRTRTNSVPCGSILEFQRIRWVKAVVRTNSSRSQLGTQVQPSLKMESCTFGAPAFLENSNDPVRSNSRTTSVSRVSM